MVAHRTASHGHATLDSLAGWLTREIEAIIDTRYQNCSTVQDTAFIVREFLQHPTAVGAIAPSSQQLAKAVVAPIPAHGDPVVVELGPGTGAFTRAIQSRLGTRGRHIAVEVNPRLAKLTALRHPSVEVAEASAEHLPRILANHGVAQADLIISGLPWVALPAPLRDAMLDATTTVLSPGGVFTTFGYAWVRVSTPARRFRRALGTRFEEVIAGRTILRNVPPAFVYYARRPLPR